MGGDAAETAQAAVQEQCSCFSKRTFEELQSARNLKREMQSLSPVENYKKKTSTISISFPGFFFRDQCSSNIPCRGDWKSFLLQSLQSTGSSDASPGTAGRDKSPHAMWKADKETLNNFDIKHL